MICFKKRAKQLVDIIVEMSSCCLRGLVMLTCYLQTGRWSRPATACGFRRALCIFLCTLETVPSAISARRPPTERETAFAHTLSLFFSPWSTSANLLSPDHQPLATANCLQPCYSAYCLLSATPSSATLATPLLSTACGTIKLQLSYKE